MISAADYLFPNALQVTPSRISRVLLIGSCMSEDYMKHFAAAHPGIAFEHILFNHLAKLPDRPAPDMADYDLQVVQIPIRYVLGDRVIRFNTFADDGEAIVTELNRP